MCRYGRMDGGRFQRLRKTGFLLQKEQHLQKITSVTQGLALWTLLALCKAPTIICTLTQCNDKK